METIMPVILVLSYVICGVIYATVVFRLANTAEYIFGTPLDNSYFTATKIVISLCSDTRDSFMLLMGFVMTVIFWPCYFIPDFVCYPFQVLAKRIF